LNLASIFSHLSSSILNSFVIFLRDFNFLTDEAQVDAKAMTEVWNSGANIKVVAEYCVNELKTRTVVVINALMISSVILED